MKAVRKFILDAAPQARPGSMDAEIVAFVKDEAALQAIRASLFAKRQGGKPKLGIDENTPYDIKRGLADEIMALFSAHLDSLQLQNLVTDKSRIQMGNMHFDVGILSKALKKGLVAFEIISVLPKLAQNMEDGDNYAFMNNLLTALAGIALVFLPGFAGLAIGVAVGVFIGGILGGLGSMELYDSVLD